VEPNDPRRVAAISAAVGRLRIDHAAAEAIRALAAARIPCILLKGASVARWLYEPEDARMYGDCDLLVPPADFSAALQTLAELGFEAELDESEMPSWWREHAVATTRPADGISIDVHRSIPGAHVSDTELWAALFARTVTAPVGGGMANVLTKPGRALHAALHAAQHAGSARDLDVLHRAIDHMDEEGWRSAAELASKLRATAALRRGLSFLPAGEDLAQRLGLDGDRVIEVELRAVGAPEALTIARIFAANGTATRLSLVRHKLAPPPTFMRKWSPLARRGRLGLAASYAWRPIWVTIRMPRAATAWARARRSARAHKSGRAV
jgi:hypothetical protein